MSGVKYVSNLNHCATFVYNLKRKTVIKKKYILN